MAYVNRGENDEFNQEGMMNKRRELEQKMRAQGFLQYLFHVIKEAISEWYVSHQTYSHCEIAIPNETEVCTAYGVFSSKGVFQDERTFKNPSYRWIFLETTEREFNLMRNFCVKQLGKEYDPTGPFISVVKPRPCVTKFWCVPFVVQALQKAGLCKFLNASALDVDDVIQYLLMHPKRVDGFDRQRLKLFETDSLESIAIL